MRFPSSLFLQGARNKGGVILEDDGEVTVPPVMQPSSMYPGVYSVGFTSPVVDSFSETLEIIQTGVEVAQTISGVDLAAGLWLIQWRAVFFMAGTLDFAKFRGVQLISPGGNVKDLYFIPFDNGTQTLLPTGELLLHLGDSGFNFRISSDASVLGDNIYTGFSYLANKLL